MQLIPKNKSYSLYVFFLVGISVVFSFNFFVNWGDLHHPFKNDVNQYYSYLNGLFIDHDLTFRNNLNGYWLIETPIHHFVPKVTYGMALFYSPFYLLAKFFASNSSTGYEPIYACLVHFGCILYILIGLWYTRKTLLLFFNETITSIVIALLFFGTNLFYYTVSESESVHGVLFFLISVFLYNTVKWHQTNNKYFFLVLSLIAGFVCLIRPTECLILLFPLLIGITSMQTVRLKFFELKKLNWNLFIGALLFILPILPQLFYWKMQSGQWFFFSYGSSERFFWTEPKVMNVLFSYRKGWLVYTPIMLLSLTGFIILYRKNKGLFFPILIYFLLNLYLISAWWDWAFGGSFGMRALIQTYVFLVIPFAYTIQWLLETCKKKIIIYGFCLLALFLVGLNILQSNLYKHGIIDYDGMTKEAYWFTFMKKKYTPEDLVYLKTLVKHPNYEARRKGLRDD